MKQIKQTRYFDGFSEYENYYESHEHAENITDVVDYGNRLIADGEYSTKNWQTAIKRFARHTGWDWILQELESSSHSEYLIPDCDSVAFEYIDDNTIYVCARQYK